MVEPLAELGVATTGFGLFLALHLPLWNRRGASRAGFGLMIMLWLIGLGVALGGAFWLRTPVHVLTVVAVGGCLMAFYLHLYTGMLRSVSLRLLGEIDAAGGRLQVDAIQRVYSPESMLDSRLAWLVERGLLDEQDGRYRVTASGRRLLDVRRRLAGLLVEGPTG